MDASDPNFDEVEYRKVLKTRNQNMVKLQRYRVAKQIEKMQPTIHFMEEGRKSEQFIFAESPADIEAIIHKHRKEQSEDEEELLGKRGAFEDQV